MSERRSVITWRIVAGGLGAILLLITPLLFTMNDDRLCKVEAAIEQKADKDDTKEIKSEIRELRNDVGKIKEFLMGRGK